MTQSKPWQWEIADQAFWSQPSEDIYYYLHRWKAKNFTNFLDLGCGLGRHAILFAQNGFGVHALDLSEKAIETLKAKAAEQNLPIHANHGDMNHLPYPSEQFDCLLAYHVISHTDSVGIIGIIDEIKRVIKPEGEFFITFCSKNSPTYKNPKHKKLDANTILKTEGPEIDVPHYYPDFETIKELLKDFKIIRIRHIQEFEGDTPGSWHYFVHGQKVSQ